MRTLSFLALFLILIGCPNAQLFAKEAMVLLPIQGNGISAQEKDVLRAALQEGLSRRYKVFSGAEVDKKLQKFIKKSCDTQKCLQDVAINFQGELVGRGVVLPSGGDYLLTIEIKNVFTDNIVESKTESCSRCNLSGVISLLKKMTRVQSSLSIQGRAVDIVTSHFGDDYRSPDFSMLVMESQPSGALVLINGNAVGKTPYQNFDMAVGEKLRVHLSKPGYVNRQFEFTVKHGANELLNLSLEKALGNVVVTTDPYERGAKIYLGNSEQIIGEVPAQVNLRDGKYTLRVIGEKTAGQKEITVKSGERINVIVSINKKTKNIKRGYRNGEYFKEIQGEKRHLNLRNDKQKQGVYEAGELYRSTLKDGSSGPEMIVIPGGSFRMGDIQGAGLGRERPVHKVTIKRTFALGKTEVTFEQYDKFTKATSRAKISDESWGRGNRPVINVSWNDAAAYAEWLSQQTGEHYRLPSEAEWEYAARARSETVYPWGHKTSHEMANSGAEQCCDGLASGSDAWVYTSPVGSFLPNQFGLLDMAGNVWEWTQDCWNYNYKGSPSDGTAWLVGECVYSVSRGGSWKDSPSHLRSSNRVRFPSGFSDTHLGFRLAQVL